MDSMVFKYKHHYQQQNQHFNRRDNNHNHNNMNKTSNINNSSASSHNNNNQNSIFILNTATNNILSSNPQLYYSDLNDQKAALHASPSTCTAASSSSSSSSVWSSASSTMCSPAAHALQKLFNCSSSTSSLKFHHGRYSGIESNFFKSKSEILKKKSKFWKYLEGEDNDKSNPRGIDDDPSANEKNLLTKSSKLKSSWSKSFESDSRNQQELSELLEYSCSLCDNCRCMDCQIGYFDCENSDDSSSEYSFHLSAYEEDEEADNSNSDNEQPMELKSAKQTYENCCADNNEQLHSIRKLQVNMEMPLSCTVACCICKASNCLTTDEHCPQCFLKTADKPEINQANFFAAKDH